MIPTRFAQSNITMLAPRMDNCFDIHAWRGNIGDSPYVITAWHPTPEELVKINLGEPVFLLLCGCTMQPALVTVDNPFVQEVPEK